MTPKLLEPFDHFPNEGILIGRLLCAYGELENALCSCVAMARDDMDMVVKAMFRPRGETQRVDIADSIGRKSYRELGLETQFAEAIGAIRHCLKIRNQFSHCNWHDDKTGKLCFVDMQEIAIENTVITNLLGLTFHYIDVPLLAQQETYFSFVGNCLIYLNYEGRTRARRISSHTFSMPKKVDRPPLFLP